MPDSKFDEERGLGVSFDEGSGSVVSLSARRAGQAPDVSVAPAAGGPVVSFDRHELGEILRLYGRMVAAGEWRDYAIDFTRKRAVFSVFRRASEVPLFRIEKDPALRHKQGAYSVVAASGAVLRRGQDLRRVIAVLDRPVRVI